VPHTTTRVKTKTLMEPGFRIKRGPTRAPEIDKLRNSDPHGRANSGILAELRLRKADFTTIG